MNYSLYDMMLVVLEKTKFNRTLKIILVTVVLTSTITIILYHDALNLVYYADDLQQIPWIKSTGMLSYWDTLGPYEDWRPLRFMLLRFIYIATGDLSPTLVHSLNLVGHIICATLVGWIVARQDSRSWILAPLAGTIYTVFPFAANVIFWVSAISYPLTSGLCLAALLCYLYARERKSVKLHTIAVIFTLMAGMVYEGGIVAWTTVVLAELVFHRRPYSQWVIAHVIASLIPFSIIYLLSTAIPQQMFSGLHPHLGLVAMLQCIAYPFAQLAMLGASASGNTTLLVTVIGITVLFILGVLAVKRKNLRWFFYSLGWVFLWSILPLATQAFNWFRDPGRSFYPASAGIAMLWATSLASVSSEVKHRGLRSGLQIVLTFCIIISAAPFIRNLSDTYRMTGDVLWEAIYTAQKQPGALFVNVPGRITPNKRTYPLIHEGIIPLPPPTNGEMFFAVHNVLTPDVTARSFYDILPAQLPYSLELADPPLGNIDIVSAERIYVVNYKPETILLTSVGNVRTSNQTMSFLASFGDYINLVDAECRWISPTNLELTVTWQAATDIDGNPTVFVHYLNDQNMLVAQSDGAPLGGLYPITMWQIGDVITDIRLFEDVNDQSGAIRFGIWDPENNQRWETRDASGAVYPDNTFRLTECAAANAH